jgi:hypothetical protein
MKSLRELSWIINKYAVRHIDVISNFSPENNAAAKQGGDLSLVGMFYDKLQKNEFDTDEDAADFFFATRDAKDKRYLKLKNELKRRMLNSAFFIDTSLPMFNDTQKAYFNCWRNYANAQIIAQRAAVTSEKLLNDTLEYTTKYEFYELTSSILINLIQNQATLIGDFNQLEKLKQKYYVAKREWDAEVEATIAYSTINVLQVKKKGKQAELFEVANTAYERLLPTLDENKGVRLHMFVRLIGIIKSMATADYEEALKISEEGIAFVKTKPFEHKVALTIFYHHKAICQIQLSHLFNAIKTAEQTLALAVEGDFNWFRSLELLMLSQLRAGATHDAFDSYLKAINHKQFDKLIGSNHELWLLYGANFQVLLEAEKIHSLTHKWKPINIKKLNDNIIELSKDKKGYNIPILIVQLLSAAWKKDFDTIVDKIDSLDKYLKRHADEKHYARARVFLKMVLLLSKKGHDKQALHEKTRVLFEELKRTHFDFVHQKFEVEIIPFEICWKILCEAIIR